MAAKGQSRHFDRRPITSGLLPIADIVRLLRNQKDRPTKAVCSDGECCNLDLIRLEAPPRAQA